METQNKKINTTLITGPLGAGKTTILKEHGISHYKQNQNPDDLKRKIKLIVNDAALGNKSGEFHTDGRRLSGQLKPEELEMYGQSCVCCDGQDTLETALKNLNPNQTNRLIIEPTGIANARNIVESINSVNTQKPDETFTINNITYVFPVARFSKIEQHPGLITANNIILSHLEGASTEKIKQAQNYISKLNSDSEIFMFDNDFDWKNLDENWSKEMYQERKSTKKIITIGHSSPMKISQTKNQNSNQTPSHTHKHAHAHYNVKTFDLNPYTHKEDSKTLENTLRELDKQEIERVKGHIRIDSQTIKTFDLARGKISYQTIQDKDNLYSNGSLEIISEHIPKQISETLSDITEGARDCIALIGSTQSDLESLLKQKSNDMAQIQIPNNNQKIPQTYEAADVTLAIANQISTEGYGTKALEQTFPTFFEIQNQTMNSLQNNSNHTDFKARQAILGIKVMYELDSKPELITTINLEHLEQFSTKYLDAANNLQTEDFKFLKSQSNPNDNIEYINTMKSTAQKFI
jgi:G3E family GTPase